jgi:hypothetical protein
MSNNKLTKSLDDIIKSNRQNQKALTVIKREGQSNNNISRRGSFRSRNNWNRRNDQSWIKGRQAFQEKRLPNIRRQDRRNLKVCTLILL